MVIFLSDESESWIFNMFVFGLCFVLYSVKLSAGHGYQEFNWYCFWRGTKELEWAQRLGPTEANVVYRFRNRLMMSLLSVYFILFYFHKCRQAGQTKFVRSAVKWSLPHAINAPELRWVETFLKTHWYFAVGAHLSRGNWAKFQNNQLFFGWAP